MKIQLDDNWTVEADAASWNLEFRKEGELNDKGNPIISHSISYHARFVDALHKYIDETSKDATTLKEIVDIWHNATNRAEIACKGITKQKVGNEWQIVRETATDA